MISKPAAITTSANAGAVATATSCPAFLRLRASGSSGLKWPRPGMHVRRKRIGLALSYACTLPSVITSRQSAWEFGAILKHIYISPHADDVALSCGGQILSNPASKEDTLVLNVFTSEGEVESCPVRFRQ